MLIPNAPSVVLIAILIMFDSVKDKFGFKGGGANTSEDLELIKSKEKNSVRELLGESRGFNLKAK